MAKKKEIGKNIKELKDVLDNGRAIIGKARVLTNLKTGKLDKVFLTSNVAQDLRDDIIYYADMAKVEIILLDQDNEELGILAKKNHFISIIGVSAQ